MSIQPIRAHGRATSGNPVVPTWQFDDAADRLADVTPLELSVAVRDNDTGLIFILIDQGLPRVWGNLSSGGETLGETLVNGKETDGTDLVVSPGDVIRGEDTLATGEDLIMRAGDSLNPGGDEGGNFLAEGGDGVDGGGDATVKAGDSTGNVDTGGDGFLRGGDGADGGLAAVIGGGGTAAGLGGQGSVQGGAPGTGGPGARAFISGSDAGATSGAAGGNTDLDAGVGQGAGADGRVRSLTTHEFLEAAVLREIPTPSAEANKGVVWVDDGVGAPVDNSLNHIDAAGNISRLDVGGNFSNVQTLAPGVTLTPGAGAVLMAGLAAASPEAGTIPFTEATALWTASRDGTFEFRVSAILAGVGAAEALDLILAHSISGIIAQQPYTPEGATSQGPYSVFAQRVMLSGETVQIQVSNGVGASVTPVGVNAIAQQIG